MAIRQVSFAAPQQQSPLVQALAPRSPLSMISAQALQEGTSTAPVQSIGEGLARLGQAGLGGWFAGAEKRRADEASGRLADAVLGAMPESQRSGPTGQMLAAALRDPNVGPALLPSLLTNLTRQPEAPAGFRVRPDGSMEAIPGGPQDPNVLGRNAAATRDPASRYRIVPGQDGQPPLVVDTWQLGQGGQPAQGGAADYPVQAQTAALAQLRQAESGGNPNAQGPQLSNGTRATGLYQFTPETWQSTLQAHPELAQRFGPNDMTNPQAQEAVARAFEGDILRANADLLGRDRTVNGVPVTPEALVRGAWLGGIQGVRRYIESNGQYNPADANGTRISDYFNGTARNMQTAQAQPQTATDAAPGPQYPPGVRPLIQGNQGPTTTQFNRANTLRDEYTRGSQTFQTVQDAYQNIRSAASNSTGAGDMSMLYSFVKLLDPTSVVRESEFATAAASGSLGERIQGLYQRIVSGERLPDSLRRDFMREAEAIYRTHTTAQRRRQDEYGRIARMYGVDPSGVTIDFTRPELQTPWEPPAPPAPTQPVPAQPAAQPAAPPSTPIPQPGVGTGQQVPIPPMPTDVAPQPAVPPRGAIPREQILEELRRRGLQAR